MTNNEEKLETLLATAFESLAADDRSFVLTMMSAAEYDELRAITLELGEHHLKENITPNEQTLQHLHLRLTQNTVKVQWWLALFQVRFPAYATVLLMMASVATGAMLKNNDEPQRQPVTVLVKTDTLYVTKTDTIVREKTIYRTVANMRLPAVSLQTQEAALEQINTMRVSVSMKEKEDLNKFLVSDVN